MTELISLKRDIDNLKKLSKIFESEFLTEDPNYKHIFEFLKKEHDNYYMSLLKNPEHFRSRWDDRPYVQRELCEHYKHTNWEFFHKKYIDGELAIGLMLKLNITKQTPDECIQLAFVQFLIETKHPECKLYPIGNKKEYLVEADGNKIPSSKSIDAIIDTPHGKITCLLKCCHTNGGSQDSNATSDILTIKYLFDNNCESMAICIFDALEISMFEKYKRKYPDLFWNLDYPQKQCILSSKQLPGYFKYWLNH